jgi:hypothetical protein
VKSLLTLTITHWKKAGIEFVINVALETGVPIPDRERKLPAINQKQWKWFLDLLSLCAQIIYIIQNVSSTVDLQEFMWILDQQEKNYVDHCLFEFMYQSLLETCSENPVTKYLGSLPFWLHNLPT